MSSLALTAASLGSLSLWGERAAEFFRFEYAFVIHALLVAGMVGLVAGVVGVLMVLRGMSLLGDATGHATLPGVCAAFLITGTRDPLALMLGALVAAGLAAWFVSWLSERARTRRDANIGISLSLFFALGVVLLSRAQHSPSGMQAGIDQLLLGSAAGVTREQVVVVWAVGLTLLTLLLVFYRGLAHASFDGRHGAAVGVPVRALEVGLIVALSLVVVIAIESVGVVLVAAMLVVPPSTGLLLGRRLPSAMVWGGATGLVAGTTGVFLSFLQEGLSTGPTMVLVATALFLVALALTSLRGRVVGAGPGGRP